MEPQLGKGTFSILILPDGPKNSTDLSIGPVGRVHSAHDSFRGPWNVLILISFTIRRKINMRIMNI